MANVFLFKSRAELSTSKNLESFIELAKNKVKLWSSYEGFEWDSVVWPTHYKNVRFHNIDGRQIHHTKLLPHEMTLSSPFIDFAKAYLRYTQHIKQTKIMGRTMAALALLERSFICIDKCADITKASPRHFDAACNLLNQLEMKDRTGIGNALAKIANDIAVMHITIHGTKYWQHPFRGKYIEHHDNKARGAKEKLPSDDALFALAEIFANGYYESQDDEDVYISCQTCLLLSAPQRINESRWYRTDMLKDEKDSQGIKQLYISYWVPKNVKYVKKEVPKTMAEHTEEAVNRLLKITEEGRALAKHYETNPTQFYRHENCPDVDNNDVLSVEQLAQAIGVKNKKSAEDFLRKETGNYRLAGWTLNRLWNEVILPKHERLNPHFPYQISPEDRGMGTPPKMSESLMCFRYRQLANSMQTSPILLAPFNRDYYGKRIENRDMKRGSKMVNMSIFSKYGYGDLALKSHQLRHFLNTLAQEAGIGIESITVWSTRVSQAQSRTYMHQDPMRKAQKIADQSNHEIEVRPPITEDEYALMDRGPVINTRYGVCSHDYTLTPCHKHADCLHCSELLICKGHERTMDAIRDEYAKLTENLNATKARIDAGEQVASRWHKEHSYKHERLTELLNLINNPDIENGSIIRVASDDFSHQRRIIQDKTKGNSHQLIKRDELSLDYSSSVGACLDILREETYE